MPKTERPRNRYRIAEAKQQMRDKIGSDKVEVETDDGYILELPHPMFYDKATKAALKPLAEDDAEGILRVLVGDELADEFIMHDGDPEDLQYVWMQLSEDTRDVLAGRKRPTRS